MLILTWFESILRTMSFQLKVLHGKIGQQANITRTGFRADIVGIHLTYISPGEHMVSDTLHRFKVDTFYSSRVHRKLLNTKIPFLWKYCMLALVYVFCWAYATVHSSRLDTGFDWAVAWSRTAFACWHVHESNCLCSPVPLLLGIVIPRSSACATGRWDTSGNFSHTNVAFGSMGLHRKS